MNYKTTLSLVLLLLLLGSIGCTKESDDFYTASIKYWGDIRYKVSRFGEGKLDYIAFNNGAQGMAIYNNVLYQLFNGGFARVYNFTEDIPEKINEFPLGSNMAGNHAGSCQFLTYEGDKMENYLYVAACNIRKCFVERISKSGSVLVQTITAEVTDLMPDNMMLAMQIGDDGFLYGNGRIGTTLYNYKFRKITLSEGEGVTLTDEDLLDYWIVDGYDIDHYMRQSFKFKDGLLFFLYGLYGQDQHRGIDIYDVERHEKIGNIPLDEFTSNELEGIEVFNNAIYVMVMSNYGLKISLL